MNRKLELFDMRYSVIFLVDQIHPRFHDFLTTMAGVFQERGEAFEVIVVANGVEGFVKTQLGNGAIRLKDIKAIAFSQPVSPSACLRAALNECRGSIVMVTGAFQELTADSYRNLLNAWDCHIDVVLPYRKVRNDPLFNRMHSMMLNKLLGDAVGISIHDIGCEVRLFRREVLDNTEIYGNLNKYLPLLAVQKGYKIREIECDQLNRFHKTRYYGFRLYLSRLTEIMNLFFSARFSRKPLRFFSLSGAVLMGFGWLSFIYIGAQKIIHNTPIGSRPLLIVGLIALVAGAQIASFGLLGEIIAFIHGRSRKEYTIEKSL
jgi:hypothetical protein